MTWESVCLPTCCRWRSMRGVSFVHMRQELGMHWLHHCKVRHVDCSLQVRRALVANSDDNDSATTVYPRSWLIKRRTWAFPGNKSR